MRDVLIQDVTPRFAISKTALRSLANNFIRQPAVLDLALSIGTMCHGGFCLPHMVFQGNSIEFRRLALGIVSAVHAQGQEIYFPIKDQCTTHGVQIWSYSETNPKSFTYKRQTIVKQYPWYPKSKKWDPFVELPRFHFSPLPGQPEQCHRYLGVDLDGPHVFSIGGYPSALYRLARCLLDYANSDDPPEWCVTLEVEGGFRGVGPFSYEASFTLTEA